MHRRLLAWIILTCLVPLSAVAEADVGTGTTGKGLAMLMFAVAGGLLLTLVLPSASRYLVQAIGSRIGHWRIRGVLDKLSADVLHDCIVPGAYGGLTRIEYAVLTGGGIVCLQSKFCSGTVFGQAEDAQWTNVDGGRRRRFLNPLIQGEGRRRALQKIVPDAPVASLVVFTGSSEFVGQLPDNVISISELGTVIERLDFGTSTVEDWNALWLTVRSAARTDADSRKDYAAQLSFG